MSLFSCLPSCSFSCLVVVSPMFMERVVRIFVGVVGCVNVLPWLYFPLNCLLVVSAGYRNQLGKAMETGVYAFFSTGSHRCWFLSVWWWHRGGKSCSDEFLWGSSWKARYRDHFEEPFDGSSPQWGPFTTSAILVFGLEKIVSLFEMSKFQL